MTLGEQQRCVPNFLRRCNMSQVLYLSDASIVGTTHRQLVTSPPSDTDSTGWTIADSAHTPGYTGFPSWTFLSSGFINNAYSFSGTSPVPTAETFGSGFRSPKHLTGTFFGTSGTLTVRLHSNKHDLTTGTVTGKLTARLFKGNGASMFQAHEITNVLAESSQFTFVDNQTIDVVIPLSFNNFVRFDDEYLFVMMGLEIDSYSITNGGSTNKLDLVIDYGSSTTLVIPSLSPNRSEQVCTPYGQSEMYIYISPDGVQYPLDVDGRRVVLSDQGTGTPAYEYITQRGPFQHGTSLIAVYAQPRVLQLVINQTYDNRDSYWNGRNNLLYQLNPRKQAIDGAVEQGVLRRILSTGEKRDLKCLITEGPKFEPRHENAWQEYSYTETLRFTAFDPIYYDPNVQSYMFDKQGSQLIFPATFPITFSTILQTSAFLYNGTWLTYPTITITGPMVFFHLVNETTDEKIDITYDLAVGETITIDLQYGNKAVTKNDGTNLLPYVSNDSDLGTFHITEANQGVNQFHVHMIGVMSPSQVEMNWNDRYVGI